MSSDFSLDKRTKELEDAFFLKQDQKLIEELRKMKALEETKENLRQASCIHDDRILEKLVELDIQAEMVAALTAVPLIEVAWADGQVDDKEREAILNAAGESGIELSSNCHSLLTQWLTHKPDPKLMEAWTHYIEGLCAAMKEEDRERLKKDLLDRARRVAEASGGFLGLASKISAQERNMLKQLEQAFEKE
jgi:hypothetical protein